MKAILMRNKIASNLVFLINDEKFEEILFFSKSCLELSMSRVLLTTLLYSTQISKVYKVKIFLLE